MRKCRSSAFLCFSLIVLFAGCGGGGGSSQAPAPTSIPAAKKSYTFMVYMIGSNLESKNGAASADGDEMVAAPSSDNVNVVMTTGGANTAGWTTVKRIAIKNKTLEQISDLGDLDMANPTVLKEFVVWAQTTYPADHFTLVLWDHGGGTLGFGSDENHGGSVMSINQIRQALSDAVAATGKTFDIIGFDACLMGSVEVAYNVAPYAKYLVASEETEPAHGWDYTAILSAIVGNPTIDGATLGRAICDSYKAQANQVGASVRAAGKEYNGEQTITLSLVDLSKVGAVASALGALGTKGTNDFTATGINAWYPVASGRSKSEEYGASKATETFFDMVDIKDFASNLQPVYPTEAAALSSAVDQAVVYKVAGAQKPHANGMSVFMPNTSLRASTALSQKQMDTYSTLNFPAEYRNMVKKYVDTSKTDKTAPTFANLAASGTTMSATVVGSDVKDVYALITQTAPAGDSITFLGLDLATMGSGGGVSYDFTGMWVTLNGQYVSPFVMEASGTIYLLDIPILLNGSIADLLALFDSSTQEFLILGAWPGGSNEMAEKALLPIASTDQITPQFFSYNLATGDYSLLSGASFVVGGSLTLGATALPDGLYDLMFFGVDYAQNAGASGIVTYTISTPSPGSPAVQIKSTARPLAASVGGNTGIPDKGKILEMIRNR